MDSNTPAINLEENNQIKDTNYIVMSNEYPTENLIINNNIEKYTTPIIIEYPELNNLKVTYRIWN